MFTPTQNGIALIIVLHALGMLNLRAKILLLSGSDNAVKRYVNFDLGRAVSIF